MKVIVPPIKSQGIKTKLVPWIKTNIENINYNRWVEPFMGTGVVAFNIRPQQALLCDSNPHIIAFYKALQKNTITSQSVKKHLQKEGQKLLDSSGDHYYKVRERFNTTHDPLDFIFLSRSCFNGMMRFNKKGGFNVPFCKKPNRFAQALVTKITNQVENVAQIIQLGDYEFKNQDFKETLKEINNSDFVYADPPYLGRNVDYFDSWTEEDELNLNSKITASGAKFMLSTWLKNKYRVNDYIFSVWKNTFVSTKEHFYHLGASEKNRNSIIEALLTNFELKNSLSVKDVAEKIKNNESVVTST